MLHSELSVRQIYCHSQMQPSLFLSRLCHRFCLLTAKTSRSYRSLLLITQSFDTDRANIYIYTFIYLKFTWILTCICFDKHNIPALSCVNRQLFSSWLIDVLVTQEYLEYLMKKGEGVSSEVTQTATTVRA